MTDESRTGHTSAIDGGYNPPVSSSQKIERVLGLLTEPGILKSVNLTNGNGDGSVSASPEIKLTRFLDPLARSLYARATPEFLDRKSEKNLAFITVAAFNALNEWSKRDKPVLLKWHESEQGTGLFIALTDRPFIINTIRQNLKQRNLKYNVHLHPVILFKERQVSLSYLEFEDRQMRPDDALESLLTRALSDLMLATEDFPSMCELSWQLVEYFEAQGHKEESPHTLGGSECAVLLRWLIEGNFIFLGLASWGSTKGKPSAKPLEQFGLLAKDAHAAETLLKQVRTDLAGLRNKNTVTISKLESLSPVHHRQRLMHVILSLPGGANGFSNETPEDKDRPPVFVSLVGLLTSQALVQEASSVPLVRMKLRAIQEMEETVPGSHDYKIISRIVDSMPKYEALILDSTALHEEITAVLNIRSAEDCRVLAHPDTTGQGIWLTAIFPSNRFHSLLLENFQKYLESTFSVTSDQIDSHLALVPTSNFSRIYYFLAAPADELVEVSIPAVESQFRSLMAGWRERLAAQIRRIFGEGPLPERYADAFNESYQTLSSPEQCISDIRLLESIHSGAKLRVSLNENCSENSNWPGQYVLTVLRSGTRVVLSEALPILENVGFKVINEDSFIIKPKGAEIVYLHRFTVRPRTLDVLDMEKFEKVGAPGLEEVFLGRLANDILNSLLITAQLPPRAITLLHTYCMLLWQMRHSITRQAIRVALSANPLLAKQFWELFEIRFDPRLSLSPAERAKRVEEGLKNFRDSLRQLRDAGHDRTLRSLAAILENTVRTNYYDSAAHVCLKVYSAKLDILTGTRPLYEIFVDAPDFEGVHLRSAKVSRGGIRWSERRDDYRTEILGLMRTQKIKNALIVPSGAKGGFVLKNPPADRTALQEAVKQAYQDFIRALLSLTDNLVDGKVQPPPNLVIYDEPDPYLVVAADKGTAVFSDLANSVAANEFNFWLGDAFASGGSQGYDHKKLGITARGVWEIVKQHFTESGIPYLTQPFSVIGIGDMSGDVFSNGMLISKNIRLIAAFDHRHIFIDPDPGLEAAYNERRRLAALPYSQWNDYKRELISKGGGVWGRFDREIKLSPEARSILKVDLRTPETVTGEQLITLILKAPADLLWNGGIGTYVKSHDESDADVDDSANDSVRINSDELRVKVVAEGGNLGFTQLARIEFAKRRGLINTDAIDNAAGVSLSDHEVNLKLLLKNVNGKRQITPEERKQLLMDLAFEVCDSVLEQNKKQCLRVTLSESQSRKAIEYFRSHIQNLSKKGYINRTQEHLPEEEEFDERVRNHEGLYRPEVAVCLAATKQWVTDAILESGVAREPFYSGFLLDYFPPRLQQELRSDLLAHPLSENIIATTLTNHIVEIGGIICVHRLCVNHAITPAMAIAALTAAYALLGLHELRLVLREIDNASNYRSVLNIFIEAGRAMREIAAWLISNHARELSAEKLVKLYAKPLQTLFAEGASAMPAAVRPELESRMQNALALRLERPFAQRIALFPMISMLLEVLWAAQNSRKDIVHTAQTCSAVIQSLNLYSFLTTAHTRHARSKWQYEFIVNTFEEIRRNIAQISSALMKNGLSDSPERIEKALVLSASHEQLRATLAEVNEEGSDVTALSVLSRQLRMYKIEWNQARK